MTNITDINESLDALAQSDSKDMKLMFELSREVSAEYETRRARKMVLENLVNASMEKPGNVAAFDVLLDKYIAATVATDMMIKDILTDTLGMEWALSILSGEGVLKFSIDPFAKALIVFKCPKFLGDNCESCK